jgi:hypothetical protein
MATEPAFNPDNYTKDQLSKILQAFFDISDGVQAHDYQSHTGDSSPTNALNFAEAKKLVGDKYRG